MRLSFILLYVTNLQRSIDFYQKAFGLKCRLIHESGLYAEMETGTTTLGFSQHELLRQIGLTYTPSSPKSPPAGIQISFEPDDVDLAYDLAIKAGAISVTPPETMPWGWKTAFVRDPDGVLIELAKEL